MLRLVNPTHLTATIHWFIEEFQGRIEEPFRSTGCIQSSVRCMSLHVKPVFCTTLTQEQILKIAEGVGGSKRQAVIKVMALLISEIRPKVHWFLILIAS